MAKTIDMQYMRYINLFGKVSKVSTTDCFTYNNTLYFAVPKNLMSMALGKNAENVKTLSLTLRKRVRIIAKPKVVTDSSDVDGKKNAIKEFVKDLVHPLEFTSLDYDSESLTVNISGSREQKAMLIGRDRSKQKELQEVLETTFGVKEVKFI